MSVTSQFSQFPCRSLSLIPQTQQSSCKFAPNPHKSPLTSTIRSTNLTQKSVRARREFKVRAVDDDEWGPKKKSQPASATAISVVEPPEIDELKKPLVDSLHGTDEGLKVSSETRAEVVELITQLEAKNPTPKPTDALGLLNGRRTLATKSFRVYATTLQDDEQKVAMEESFQPNSLPDDYRSGNGGREPSEDSTSSNGFEMWAIKFEQSINIFLTDSVIKILDTLYHDRHYARFFVLETIARVPYFAFMSVLHMYESFGWWRRADYIKVHFAESWNEMHHLLIMEELGGNSWWFDRFLAQHIAAFYYVMTALMYAISPRMAYHFSECVESHAFETYDKYIKTHREELKNLPAPDVAVKYYMGDDMYLFDEFQTSRVPSSRRPKIENLYDVFLNIRDDEAEHCKTMKACQTHGNLRSPHSTPWGADVDDELGCVLPQDCEGIVDCIKKSVTVSPANTSVKKEQ